MTTRTKAILEIARNNAFVGLDQRQVDAYEDNMRDALVEAFPDLTQRECALAEDEFFRLIRAATV